MADIEFDIIDKRPIWEKACRKFGKGHKISIRGKPLVGDNVYNKLSKRSYSFYAELVVDGELKANAIGCNTSDAYGILMRDLERD